MFYGAILDTPIKSNFSDFYFFPKFFTKEMINKLENLVYNNYTFEKGKVGSAELNNLDSSIYNNRDIAYIVPSNDSQWLYEILEPLVIEANENLFNFDIKYVTDAIHYVIYPENGGHLDWHMDVGYGAVNRRKLSLTIQLSDPSEYQGGEFEIWYGKNDNFVELPRQQGDVIIFPSFLMHRVKPVIQGQRKALVFWVGGEPFK